MAEPRVIPQVPVPEDLLPRLREEAEARHALHKGQGTHRPLYQASGLTAGHDYEFIGVCGEWAFCQWAGLPFDWQRRPGGDGRYDVVWGGHSLDVKTGASNAFNLLREENKAHAEILVLTDLDHTAWIVKLLGWEFDEEMVKQPKRRFHAKGPLNHYLHRTRLKPIMDLPVYIGN